MNLRNFLSGPVVQRPAVAQSALQGAPLHVLCVQ